MLRVSSGFCVVMRIGMNMGMDNSCATNNVRMGKESRTCVETHKEHYKKERQYVLCFDHFLEQRKHNKNDTGKGFTKNAYFYTVYCIVLFMVQK